MMHKSDTCIHPINNNHPLSYCAPTLLRTCHFTLITPTYTDFSHPTGLLPPYTGSYHPTLTPPILP